MRPKASMTYGRCSNDLLDTNACISYLNQPLSPIRTRIGQCSPNDIVLCSVVKAELFYGVMKSRHSAKNLAKLQPFYSQFVSLYFDDQAAQMFGEIRASLEQLGTPIGAYDLQIAAIALANQLILVTHNVREFARVPGLQYEDWEI